ncbi:protein YpfM [Citrobacter freundii]
MKTITNLSDTNCLEIQGASLLGNWKDFIEVMLRK